MSYIAGGSTIRADINQALIEAPQADVGLIGATLLPLQNVQAKSGTYLKVQLAAADLLSNNSAARGNGSEYQRGIRSFASANYDTQEFGLEELLDDASVQDLNRFFAVESETAKFLLRQIKLGHEKRVSDLLWAGSTPFTTADQNRAVAYTNTNIATVDVARDVAAAKLALNKLGYEPNCIAMSANVFELIRRSTLLQNQFFGVISNTGARLLSEAEIAAALGVQTLAVGRAAYNTANKGKSYSGSFIVPDSKIIVGQIAGGEFTAGGIGRTLVWAADAAGFVSESYRDEARRSNVLRVRMNTDEVVIDSNAAVRITTDYSAS
jgi:hypothetical protein